MSLVENVNKRFITQQLKEKLDKTIEEISEKISSKIEIINKKYNAIDFNFNNFN